VNPRDKLVDFAVGGRPFATVIQHDFHHPPDHRHVVGLPLVIMPALDHPGIGGRHVDLAETLEHLVVGPQDLHQASPLVGDYLQFFDHHPVDHFFSPRFLETTARFRSSASPAGGNGNQSALDY